MTTRDISVCAILTAALTGGKLALMVVPNVEIVTLLLIAYSLTFGFRRSIIACLTFILIECFIWGIGFWLPLYFIYWPLMVTIVSLLPKFKGRLVVAIIIGVAFTALFGVLSTVIEIILLGGVGKMFWQYFYFRYLAGVPFFVTHIVSNSIILPLALPPLYKSFKLQSAKHFGLTTQNVAKSDKM